MIIVLSSVGRVALKGLGRLGRGTRRLGRIARGGTLLETRLHIELNPGFAKKPIKRSARPALAKVGVLVKRTARKSIKISRAKTRARRKHSSPGKPPYSHTGTGRFRAMRWIDWAIVSKRKETQVLIGSVGLGLKGSRTVPNVHEYGGRHYIRYRQSRLKPKKRRKGSLMIRSSKNARTVSQIRAAKKAFKSGKIDQSQQSKQIRPHLIKKSVKYAKRPFMKPAYARNKNRIRAVFKGFIKGDKITLAKELDASY